MSPQWTAGLSGETPCIVGWGTGYHSNASSTRWLARVMWVTATHPLAFANPTPAQHIR